MAILSNCSAYASASSASMHPKATNSARRPPAETIGADSRPPLRSPTGSERPASPARKRTPINTAASLPCAKSALPISGHGSSHTVTPSRSGATPRTTSRMRRERRQLDAACGSAGSLCPGIGAQAGHHPHTGKNLALNRLISVPCSPSMVRRLRRDDGLGPQQPKSVQPGHGRTRKNRQRNLGPLSGCEPLSAAGAGRNQHSCGQRLRRTLPRVRSTVTSMTGPKARRSGCRPRSALESFV